MAILDIDPRVQPIRIIVTLHPNNSLTIEGPLDDKELCKAMLDNALDVVKNSRRNAVLTPNGGELVVPIKDVSLP